MESSDAGVLAVTNVPQLCIMLTTGKMDEGGLGTLYITFFCKSKVI